MKKLEIGIKNKGDKLSQKWKIQRGISQGNSLFITAMRYSNDAHSMKYLGSPQ